MKTFILVCGMLPGRSSIKWLLFLALIFGTMRTLCVAADQPSRVQSLPALVRLENWRVAEKSNDVIQADQWPGSLSLRFHSEEGKIARVLLETPVTIPDWATGLNFVMGNDGKQGRFTIQWLVQDAQGRGYLFMTDSSRLNDKAGGVISVSNSKQRRCPMKMAVPGLTRPVMVPNSGGDIEPLGDRILPQAPLRLRGLQLKGYDKDAGSSANLYLTDFAFTRLSPATSGFYYAFDDQECFGEVDPVPNLSLGQLGVEAGGKVTVSWEALDRYDGQPFLTGGGEFSIDPKDPCSPLQFNQRIEFPIRERGTYWIRVKSARTTNNNANPAQISEREYRLDVIRGDGARPRTVIDASAQVPNSLIRIAPARSSLIYAGADPLRVPVLFWRPAAPVKSLSYRIQASSLSTAEILATAEGTLSGDAKGPARIDCDLTKCGGGSYRIHAEVLADGKLLDSLDRTIGKSGGEPVKIGHAAKGPSAEDLLSSRVPLTYLDPHVPEGPRDNPVASRKMLEDFMDQAGTITDKVELLIRWKDIEVLPGVYDWAQLDRLLAYAQTKKLTVLLWPSVVAVEPEWVPSCFTQNKEGSIFGHNRYLFHRARLDYWHAEPIRKPAIEFLAALAARYREHPAVHGYFFITEHPSEASHIGWYDGYNPEAIEHFRQHCQQTWPTLNDLNKRWKTNFKSWSEVTTPSTESSLRYTLDWLAFRRDAIGDFLVDCAKALRQADPRRLIGIYIDGLDDNHVPKLRALGCFTANGGCQDPDRGGVEYLGRAVQGLQERPEETSVGQWSCLFPTQLDASVFSMMLGGGGNAHCKMYIETNKTFKELEPAPYSLDRFKQFIPIRGELRQTVRMPMDSYVLDDRNARLMKGRTTTWLGLGSGLSRNCFQSHLLCPAVPLEIATTGKLLFLMGDYVETFEQSVMDGLVRYVEQGGTVVMQADAGRTCVETPEDRWYLLRRFGFKPPTGEKADRHQFRMSPIAGDVFPTSATCFALGDLWPAPADPSAKVLAACEVDAGRPAITWKPVGKGRVVVIWSSSIIPPTVAGSGGDYPFLHDLARWAGVRMYGDASSPRLWTNLLKHREAETYYGLVYNSVWHEKAETVKGAARWFLPEGEYRITEMISGSSVGDRTATQLKNEGVAVDLKPNAVAIYRMEWVGPSSKK